LLSIIHDKLEDYDGIKELPQIISDMISGQQERYITAYFDGLFSGNGTTSGMRLSVYCSDKMTFEDPAIMLIPMKVVSSSDLIAVTRSDAKPIKVGAKRRWRSYGA